MLDPDLEVVAAVQQLNLPPTTQEPPLVGPAEPGARSLSPSNLRIYFRGARFAAQAMGLRHGHHAEEIKEDSKAYVAEMDRFTDALDWLSPTDRPVDKINHLEGADEAGAERID